MTTNDWVGIAFGATIMFIVCMVIYMQVTSGTPITPCEINLKTIERYQPCIDLEGACLLESYEARYYNNAVKYIEENSCDSK